MYVSLGRGLAVLAVAIIGGCQTSTMQHTGGARILTGFEMDRVTAGSAVAAADAAARGLGPAPHTAALGITSASSANSPIAGAPLLDYAASRAMASVNGGTPAQTSLSTQVSVNGINGGASVGARAAATGTSQAQVTAQFYGIGTNRADFVFGSVAAGACCGSQAAAQIDVDDTARGPYTREFRVTPASDAPGQAQSRVDTAVVSSALPLLDPAQALVAGSPARASPKY